MRGRGEWARVWRRVRHSTDTKFAVLRGWLSVSVVVQQEETQSDSQAMEGSGFHGTESEKAGQKGQLRAGEGRGKMFEKIEIGGRRVGRDGERL